MGATLTAELLAEAGELKRFASADALAAAAGLAPVLRQSGKVRFQRRLRVAIVLSNASSTRRPFAHCRPETAARFINESARRVRVITKRSSLWRVGV
jgi:transposase